MTRLALLAAAAAAVAAPALAQGPTGQAPLAQGPLAPERFAVGVGGGTNGGSVEAAYAVNRYLDVRAQGAFLGFDLDVKSGGVTYRGDLHHYTGGGMVDLHPFANPFFVSGGFVSGERKLTAHASPLVTARLTVAGVSQSIQANVPLRADVALGDTAPFAGLGFDNTFTHAGHWGFRAVAGVIFGQNPKATLTTTSPLANDPVVGPAAAAALASEQASLQHDVDGYRYYPIAQVGVTYRF